VSTAAAVSDGPTSAQSGQLDDLLDRIDTAEAARVLGCGKRNATDLCARGAFPTARRTGAGGLLERADLQDRTTPTRRDDRQ
jgi:hypothetical protein